MELHSRISNSDREALELFTRLAPNMGDIAKPLYKKLVGKELGVKECYICGGKLDELISKFAAKVSEVLREGEFKSFLIGVKKDSELIRREEEVANTVRIPTWESIRNELRREIGKKVMNETSIPVDFTNPHVIIHIDIDRDGIELIIPSLMILGRYWKFGRYISQSKWIMRNGRKKYKLSVTEVLENLSGSFKSTDVSLHASGREDVDVRVFGNGRPFVIEFRKPLVKEADLSKLEEYVNDITPWLKFRLERFCGRRTIKELKSSEARKSKVYRALIYVDKPLSEDDIEYICSFFKGRVIEQRTPLRVLHRKKDILRRRSVREVKGILIDPHIAEFLIHAEGGLYIKELLHGDKGRTRPSFAEVLGCEVKVLELDVVWVS